MTTDKIVIKTKAEKALSLIYVIDKVITYIIPMLWKQAGWTKLWSKYSCSQKDN